MEIHLPRPGSRPQITSIDDLVPLLWRLVPNGEDELVVAAFDAGDELVAVAHPDDVPRRDIVARPEPLIWLLTAMAATSMLMVHLTATGEPTAWDQCAQTSLLAAAAAGGVPLIDWIVIRRPG